MSDRSRLHFFALAILLLALASSSGANAASNITVYDTDSQIQYSKNVNGTTAWSVPPTCSGCISGGRVASRGFDDGPVYFEAQFEGIAVYIFVVIPSLGSLDFVNASLTIDDAPVASYVQVVETAENLQYIVPILNITGLNYAQHKLRVDVGTYSNFTFDHLVYTVPDPASSYMLASSADSGATQTSQSLATSGITSVRGGDTNGASLSAGVIAGIAVAAVVILFLLIICFLLYRRLQKQMSGRQGARTLIDLDEDQVVEQQGLEPPPSYFATDSEWAVDQGLLVSSTPTTWPMQGQGAGTNQRPLRSGGGLKLHIPPVNLRLSSKEGEGSSSSTKATPTALSPYKRD